MTDLKYLNARVKELGFFLNDEDLVLDGSFHTVFTQDQRKIWFKGIEIAESLVFWIGDWRTGEKHKIYLGSETLDSKASRALKKFNKQIEIEREAAAVRAKAQIEEKLQTWSFYSHENSDYLVKKNLHLPPENENPSLSAKIRRGEEDAQKILVLPMWDEDGILWNIQQIYKSGIKVYWTGAKTKGLFHLISSGGISGGGVSSGGPVFLCEGYATGLKVHEATGFPVYVAFSVGNLEAVLRHAIKEVGLGNLVLLADWDGRTFKRNGHNPGMYAAQRLALKYNIRVATPFSLNNMGSEAEENTDFADIENVLERFSDGELLSRDVLAPFVFKLKKKKLNPEAEPQKTPTPPPKKEIKETEKPEILAKPILTSQPLTPLKPIVLVDFQEQKTFEWPKPPEIPIALNENGKPILPPESAVAEVMLRYFDGRLVKCSGDLFKYNGRFWEQLDDDDFLYQCFSKALQGHAKFKTLRDMIQLTLKFLPKAEKNLHAPNPHVTAFLNGTLTTLKINGRWQITFKNHHPTDLVTNCIPHVFDTTLEMQNPLFNDVLETVFKGDAETLRAVRQMYGACLAPVFPRLFMLLGKPGRGKSTILNIAMHMVHEQNISSVLPSDFGTFLAEGMIGKLVNQDGDIPTEFAIADAWIKKIEDRMPVSLNRKGRKVVRAPLPPIHIFGANGLPPTFERSVGAHKRRWTFIEFDKFNAEEFGKYNKEIVDDVVRAGMHGVINFAVRGLKDLLDCDGHYFMKSSAVERLIAWQRDNDSVEMFLDDCRNGRLEGIKAVTKDGGGREGEQKMIRRSLMWERYQHFLKEAFPNNHIKLSRNKFYQALRDKDVKEITSPKGYDCFLDFYSTMENRI